MLASSAANGLPVFPHRLLSRLPPQVGSAEVPLSVEGLFPAVGMHSLGEEVKVDLQAKWPLEEDESMMMVDSHEDDWGRLHDVRASGTVGVDVERCWGRPVFGLGLCNSYLEAFCAINDT